MAERKHIEQLFLEALRAAVHGKQVDWQSITSEEFEGLVRLSEIQFVLPMVLQAIYACPGVQALDPQMLARCHSRVRFLVANQARKTEDFLALYRALGEKNLQPLVVKGLICRSLYPQPDSRCSSDEDLLIPPEAYPVYHEALLAADMVQADPEQDGNAVYEVPYRGSANPMLLIELHKYLFPPESQAYGSLNRLFDDAAERSVTVEVSGQRVRTLCPTDHLLYLLLHAYKHFIHSGFGLRQLCDMCRFAQVYRSDIDWQWLECRCRELELHRFFSALLQIGQQELGFDPVADGVPEALLHCAPATDRLLSDLLDAGIYGQGSMSRKHSSTITLRAAAKTGKHSGGMLRTVFPKAKELEHRYPYLQKAPWLLPAAWTDRLIRYRAETRGAGSENSAAESLRIGNERLALLREYGLID